jgi:uncharacterized membrane protein YqiK
MNVIRIEVRRNETHALITKNRMRVDVIAEFFVRVGSSTMPGSTGFSYRVSVEGCN